MKNVVPLIGRVLISTIFLVAGVEKVLQPATTQQHMAQYGMPFTDLFLVVAIVFEIVGGLSLLLGYKACWGAIALIIFLIPATLIFHTQFSDQTQVVMFMKNLTIIGGLLMVAHFGPGPLSLDK